MDDQNQNPQNPPADAGTPTITDPATAVQTPQPTDPAQSPQQPVALAVEESGPQMTASMEEQKMLDELKSLQSQTQKEATLDAHVIAAREEVGKKMENETKLNAADPAAPATNIPVDGVTPPSDPNHNPQS